MSAPVRILLLVGSPTSERDRDLSELYARGCLEALSSSDAYAFHVAHVSPDGTWRFPNSLTAEAIRRAPRRSIAEAIGMIASLAVDAALPQMFCKRGMTDMRALLELLDIPYLGNRPLPMALAADKAKAKAVVAAVGVDVPRSHMVRPGERPDVRFPVVVKPNDSDNSDGVTLVRTNDDFEPALRAAFACSDRVLVEDYVELGREVRCGVVARGGALVALPLEEYFVDSFERPIRRSTDKLARDGDDLVLVAKTDRESWIVPSDDSIVRAVWDASLRCYDALGSRQYNLFDFRIDRDGRPWFLEAGPYCSFSPKSVIVTMMAAAGTPLERFFAESLGDLMTASIAMQSSAR